MKIAFDSLKTLPNAAGDPLAAERTERRRERQTRQAAQRREQLLDVAFALFQAEGRQGFNMRELALRSGYTPGALYAYFPGKAAILQALHQRLLYQLQASVTSAKPSRPARAARLPAPALADPLQDMLAQARQQWLAQCQAWWHWLAAEPSRGRVLLWLDAHGDAGADVLAVRSETDDGVTGNAAAQPTLLEQFLVATQAWQEPLQRLLSDPAAAQTLHEQVLSYGLGLLLLQTPRVPDTALQARFEQTLLGWLDQAAAASSTGGAQPQGDLFGA